MLLNRYDEHPDREDRQLRLDILRDVALAWDPAARIDCPTEIVDLYDVHTGLPA